MISFNFKAPTFYLTAFVALFSPPLSYAEDVNLSTYYPAPYGNYKRLQVEEASDPTLATFRGGVTRAGLQIISTYTAGNYTPGVFWTTSNDNAAIPKAGIWMNEAANASKLYFGTSNAYGTGITNQMVLNQDGYLGIGQAAPGFPLDVNGGSVTYAKFGPSTPTYLAQISTTSWGGPPDNILSFNAEYRPGTGSPAPQYEAYFGQGSSNKYAGSIVFSPNSGQMSFWTKNSTGNAGNSIGLFPSARLAIDKDGNLDMPTNSTTLRIPRRGTTGDPSGGQAGMVYLNTADNKFRGHNNTGWIDLAAAGGGGYPTIVYSQGDGVLSGTNNTASEKFTLNITLPTAGTWFIQTTVLLYLAEHRPLAVTINGIEVQRMPMNLGSGMNSFEANTLFGCLEVVTASVNVVVPVRVEATNSSGVRESYTPKFMIIATKTA